MQSCFFNAFCMSYVWLSIPMGRKAGQVMAGARKHKYKRCNFKLRQNDESWSGDGWISIGKLVRSWQGPAANNCSPPPVIDISRAELRFPKQCTLLYGYALHLHSLLAYFVKFGLPVNCFPSLIHFPKHKYLNSRVWQCANALQSKRVKTKS